VVTVLNVQGLLYIACGLVAAATLTGRRTADLGVPRQPADAVSSETPTDAEPQTVRPSR